MSVQWQWVGSTSRLNSDVQANLAKIKGKMDELKVKLYGRFGKAINLEESD